MHPNMGQSLNGNTSPASGNTQSSKQQVIQEETTNRASAQTVSTRGLKSIQSTTGRKTDDEIMFEKLASDLNKMPMVDSKGRKAVPKQPANQGCCCTIF